MKLFFHRFALALALVLSCSFHSHAQLPGGGAGASPLNAAMMKMFGQNTNFTARADVRMLDDAQKETMAVVFNMALLNGKMRAEMDMSQMKGAMISPQIIEQMKMVGADKTLYIGRPDLQSSYLIYPGLKSYLQLPMSEAEKQAFAKEPKIEKTVVGKETIDGHATVKNTVRVTDDKGKTEEATVWYATALKDFPIQIQMKEKGANVLMKFKDLQFTKPDAKQFEPPVGYTKYQSQPQFQQMMMQKMMEAMQKTAAPK